LDRIFGPSIPYVLEIGDIRFVEDDIFNKQVKHKGKENKRVKRGIDMMEDCEDDKGISDNNNQHIIPIKEYAKPFKEELKSTNSRYFHLAPTQLHQKELNEDSIKWLRTKKRGSHQNIRKHGKVYKSSDNSSHHLDDINLDMLVRRIHLEMIFIAMIWCPKGHRL
jgi:hypothetical protein